MRPISKGEESIKKWKDGGWFSQYVKLTSQLFGDHFKLLNFLFCTFKDVW